MTGNEKLECLHSDESYREVWAACEWKPEPPSWHASYGWAVLSCETIYYVAQGGSNFDWVCALNRKGEISYSLCCFLCLSRWLKRESVEKIMIKETLSVTRPHSKAITRAIFRSVSPLTTAHKVAQTRLWLCSKCVDEVPKEWPLKRRREECFPVLLFSQWSSNVWVSLWV